MGAIVNNLVAQRTSKPLTVPPGKSRNKFRTQQALLSAATSLFSRRGYAGVSTREIAQRAGYSETLIQRYFGGKRGLLAVVLGNIRDATSHDVNLALEQPGPLVDAIEGVIIARLTVHQQRAEWLRIVNVEAILDRQLSQALDHVREEALQGLREKLAERQRQGQIRSDADLDALAAIILGFSHYLGFDCQLVRGLEPASLRALAKSFAASLCEGIARGPVRPATGLQRAIRETAKPRNRYSNYRSQAAS